MKILKIGLPVWLVEMLEKQRDKASQFDDIFKENTNAKVMIIENHKLMQFEPSKKNSSKGIYKLNVITAKYGTGTYIFDPEALKIKIL